MVMNIYIETNISDHKYYIYEMVRSDLLIRTCGFLSNLSIYQSVQVH
jgi:hypothetical protein